MKDDDEKSNLPVTLLAVRIEKGLKTDLFHAFMILLGLGLVLGAFAFVQIKSCDTKLSILECLKGTHR